MLEDHHAVVGVVGLVELWRGSQTRNEAIERGIQIRHSEGRRQGSGDLLLLLGFQPVPHEEDAVGLDLVLDLQSQEGGESVPRTSARGAWRSGEG